VIQVPPELPVVGMIERRAGVKKRGTTLSIPAG